MYILPKTESSSVNLWRINTAVLFENNTFLPDSNGCPSLMIKSAAANDPFWVSVQPRNIHF